MEAYRVIRNAVEREFGGHDLVIGHWNVTVTARADGTSVLRRSRHMSEGSVLGIDMKMADPASPGDDARRFAAVVARLQRRNAALTSAGFPLSRPPAWAQVADATTAGIVERLGGSLSDLGEWRLGSNRNRGWDTGLRTASFRDARVMSADSFALRTRAHVELLSFDGLLWLGDGTGMLIVTIARHVPATLGVAAIGRPLDAIIDHPATNGLGAVIADVEQRDKLALIRIKTRLVPMAEPPAGVDVSWLMPPDDEPFGV